MATTSGSTRSTEYYGQFTAGTTELLRNALPAYCHDVRTEYADDSALIFVSSSSPRTVTRVPFFKNAFVVVARTGRGELDEGVSRLAKLAASTTFPDVPGRGDRFRVMVHVDGALAPVAARRRSELERAIARRTGARVEARGGCREYWVVGREDLAELLLCVRLPSVAAARTAKGALSPQLSAMVVAASSPDRRDRVLDPFAGSGALLAARLDLPFRRLTYSDLALARYREALPVELADDRVTLLEQDARELPAVPDGGVDVVITDPPWGEHDDVGPYDEFIPPVARSLARVLHPGHGRLVVLINRRNATVVGEALGDAGLPIDAVHEVLVHGHPASVLVGGRRGQGGKRGHGGSSTSARTAR